MLQVLISVMEIGCKLRKKVLYPHGRVGCGSLQAARELDF
jgi:hypothetical protein